MESLVSDIQAGDGNTANLFYSVTIDMLINEHGHYAHLC
jgi:hypothetical protein